MTPIRADMRAEYPADWVEVSRKVKERARWQCECAGQCGKTHPDGRCERTHGQLVFGVRGTQYKVVLTTAHMNHTPADCRDDNLRAMCQPCHLGYDAAHHAQTRVRAALEEVAASGQGTLW
jgi:hypothetical protein